MKNFNGAGRGMCSSLEPRGAQTFFIDKESMQRTGTKWSSAKLNQGVECSPKFGLRVLKSKNSPDGSESNSFDFFTSSSSKFLTAAHPKAVLVKRFKPSAFLIVFCVLFSLSLVSPAYGQGAEGLESAKRVVGYAVPNEFWEKEHLFFIDGDTVRQSLAQHKGKLLILDFWNTKCAPCLSQQSEIEFFKKNNPDDLAVIMVNPIVSKDRLQDVAKLNDNKERLSTVGISGIESIVEDEYLAKIFRPGGYPYYIWINRRGIVQIATFRNLLDRSYVAPFLDGPRL